MSDAFAFPALTTVNPMVGAAAAPVLNEGWQWAERDEAAEDLISIAFEGEDWAGAVRFSISASEANDAVLALCQALTGRAPLATRQRLPPPTRNTTPGRRQR